MTDVIFLGISLVLFFAYFGFTMVEAYTGNSVLHSTRLKIDRRVAHAFFIAKHVDWADFIAHVVGSGAARIAHDIAHVTLMSVRFIEKQLTRVVRALRDSRPNVLAPKPSRRSPRKQTVAYIQKMLHIKKERDSV